MMDLLSQGSLEQNWHGAGHRVDARKRGGASSKGQSDAFPVSRGGVPILPLSAWSKRGGVPVAAEALIWELMGSLTVLPRMADHLLRVTHRRTFPIRSLAVSTHRARVGVTYTQNLFGLVLWCWG